MIRKGKIDSEIFKLRNQDRTGLKKGQLERIRNTIHFLEYVKAYMETDPSEDFLLREKKRLTTRITLIENGFNSWDAEGKAYSDIKKKKDAYLKAMDIPLLKSQLKAIEYILD